MKFTLSTRFIPMSSLFWIKKSPLNSQEFKLFVLSGGTRDIRTIHSLCLEKRLASNLLDVPKRFKAYESHLENFFVQRSASYVFNSKFVEIFALSRLNGKPGVHPIPIEWIHVLESCSFRVNKFFSKLLWKLSLYKKGTNSFIGVIKQLLIFEACDLKIGQLKDVSQTSIWSNTINKNYFQSDDVNLYNFKNWIDIRSPISKRVIALHHNHSSSVRASLNPIDQSFQMDAIHILKGLRLKYLLDLLVILLLGTLKASIGKPEFLSVGYDLALALRVNASDRQHLPDFIFFTESDGIIKPIWASAAEDRGSHVVVVFFSACDTPMLLDEASPSFEIYRCSTWREFWVVDETQHKLLESKIGKGKAEIFVVGFPWRTDTKIGTKLSSNKLIAIFDYENIEGFYTFSTLNDVGYSGSDKEIKCLNDILEISLSFDVTIVHKPKRDISPEKRSQLYRDTLIRLEGTKSYARISPDASPNQLIDMADYVISLPVTSTAMIAKNAGKNSIYYDPIGLLNPSDICFRDVLLVQGRESLRKWFEINLSKN
jgi:polysaccharide biosynthesis PFTS motif protein